ncbi:MAG TPA: hypothetical protein VES21_01095 [Nocardioidaceae bacterium]|nr:hypothetical protein [Nocardioidaceae bacterium]
MTFCLRVMLDGASVLYSAGQGNDLGQLRRWTPGARRTHPSSSLFLFLDTGMLLAGALIACAALSAPEVMHGG